LIYKRGANPPAAGDEDDERRDEQEPFTHHVLILQFTHNIFNQGLGSYTSSPALLVAAPLQAPPVLSNIVP
jgi:hypothetical protein